MFTSPKGAKAPAAPAGAAGAGPHTLPPGRFRPGRVVVPFLDDLN